MEVNRNQVSLFVLLALTQLQKEATDEIEETNYYVRDLKREFNRRKKFDRKYIDPYIEDVFKVSSDDVINVMSEMEKHFNEIVNNSIEELLKITKPAE